MKKGLLLFVSLALAVVACSNNSQSNKSSSSKEPVDPSYKETTLKVESSYDGEEEREYELTFAYKDSMFAGKTSEFNNDLAMLSYGMSVATEEKEMLVKFNKDLGFTNTEYASEYDEKPKVKGVGYGFATKYVGDYNLVAVAVRGFNYRVQWVDNFNVGTEGDHVGFSESADLVIEALNTYVGKIKNSKPTKLWIAGYSRGGAIANVMSSKILTDTEAKFNRDNMYVYTFEAPASIDETNALAYENVHNINNEVDLITFIPPQTYGLKRCGVDYPIYDADVSTLIKEFDEEIVIPEFVPVEDLTEEPLDSDAKVRDFIINTVFNKKEDEYTDPSVYANTREQYVDNYQEGLSIALGYVFALKEATRASLLADLTALGLGALSIIGDETGVELMNFFKQYLERDGITYNEEELLSACAILIKGVQNLFLAILLMYVGDQTKGSITRLIDMHYPETTYVLLKNAHQKAQTIE